MIRPTITAMDRRMPLAAGLLVAALAVRLGVAATWGLLADEAYHWAWSQELAWGYYDQPPLIAVVLAVSESLFGHSGLGLRALPILACLGGAAALVRQAVVLNRLHGDSPIP